MPHVRSVAIGVWLKQGSRHEPAPLNGISHFIEHLLFKGTETRSAREIARVMDSVGGQMDAFTSKEYTCFYAKVLDDHLPVAVDLLADIVRHPRFDPDDVERERQVVMEEIRMVEDTPEELVYDLFASHFFGRHPLGRPIQGTHCTVATLDRPRLLRFFRASYSPANMLIAAAGRVRHDDLLRLVTKAFGPIAKGGSTSVREFVGYAHRPSTRGLVVMDTPGNDPESVTGMVAGGAQVVVFTTGRGSPTGCPIAPVIKVSSNSATYRRLADDLDLDVGTIVGGGEPLADAGRRILEEVVAVAGGKQTAAEAWGNREFAIETIGPRL
jgi:predicted Zn-dependent peptidase